MGKRQHARCCLDLYVLRAINGRRGQFEGGKLFKRYVDNIICKFRGDPDEYLKVANSSHKNVQFTLEKVNMEDELAFLVINVIVSSKKSETNRNRKNTEFWQLCTASALKKGTVQKFFNSTTTSLAFDQALKKTDIQDQKSVPRRMVNRTIEKILIGSKDQLKTTPREHQKSQNGYHNKPTIVLQYRGNYTQKFEGNM